MTRRCIERTATLAWAPSIRIKSGAFPLYVAVGSVAGALDASFSSQSELEIFVYPTESGDPSSTISRVAGFQSTARFNRLAWSQFCTDDRPAGILAAGLENGELALYNPHAMISGSDEDPVFVRSATHTAAVRGVEFNYIQQNLLGTAAGQGEILIWDLNRPSAPYSPGATKTQRLAGAELQHLSWNRCVPHILAASSSNGVAVVWDVRNRREVFALNSPAGQQSGGLWNASGASRQGAVVAWHPEVATKFLTAMEDDANPFIYMWDLRNANAPLRVMHGHNRGILSVSWCQKDSDLLLSCGMDNRTLCWNASSGEIVGELPHANNWCFDTQFCNRNPNLISVASYDGTIAFHNLMRTENQAGAHEQDGSAADPFSQGNIADNNETKNAPQISLKRPPKWLRRPCSVAFGFGGKILSFSEKSKKCHIRIVGSAVFDICKELQDSIRDNTLGELALRRAEAEIDTSKVAEWQVVRSLFLAESGRRELLQLLKEMKTEKIPENVKKHFKKAAAEQQAKETQEKQVVLEEQKKTLEIDASPTEATTEAGTETNQLKGAIVTPGAEIVIPSPQEMSEKTNIEHVETTKESGEPMDVMGALIYGSFDLAVAFCLKEKNYTDALMLAACGGRELFVKIRDQYLAEHTTSWYPIVSIVTSGDYHKLFDLNLTWGEILAALLTFCPPVALVATAGALGAMLERAGQELGVIVCYLLSGNVERLVTIWARHLDEAFVSSPIQKTQIRWGPKVAEASVFLHKLVEKVTVIMRAVGLMQYPDGMTHHFVEYAEIMAHNGHLAVAWSYIVRVAEKREQHDNQDVKANEKAKMLHILRDRVYYSMSKREQKETLAIQAPELPFTRVFIAEPQPQPPPAPVTQVVQAQGPHGSGYPRAHAPAAGASGFTVPQPPQPYGSRPPYSGSSGYPGAGYPVQPHGVQQEQHIRTAGVPYNVYQSPGPPKMQNFSQVPPQSHVQQQQRPPPSATVPYQQQQKQPNQLHQQQYNDQRNYAAPQMVVPPPPGISAETGGTMQSGNKPITMMPHPPAGPAGHMPPQFQPPHSGPPAHHAGMGQTNLSQHSVGGPVPKVGGWNDAPVIPITKRVASTASQQQHETQQMNTRFQQFGINAPHAAPQQQLSQAVSPTQYQYQHQQQPQQQQQQQQQLPPPIPNPQQQMVVTSPNHGNPQTSTSGYYQQPLGSQTPQHHMEIGGTTAAGNSIVSQQGVPPHGEATTIARSPTGTVQQPAKEFPAGDRSQIPAEHQGIYQGLAGSLAILRASPVGAQQPRVVDDVDKRLNVLFDELNRGTVPVAQMGALQQFMQAIQARDFAEARQIQMELSRMAFKPWMIGLKRLVDLLAAA